MKKNERNLGDVRKDLYAWLEFQGFKVTEDRHDMLKAAFSEYQTLSKRDAQRGIDRILKEYSVLKGRYSKEKNRSHVR